MVFELKKVEVKNFLSYRDTNFSDIKNYNVLIGKNNAGKSNLFKLFKLISRNITFEKDYLFNNDDNLDPSISLTFKLSNGLRREIFESLYRANLLRNIILKNESKIVSLPIKMAVDLLLKKKYLDSLILTVKYSKIFNRLYIESLRGIHKYIDKPVPLLTAVQKNNQIIFRFITNNIQGDSKNFLDFFGQQHDPVEHGYPGGIISDVLASLANDIMFNNSLLMKIILTKLNGYFKDLFVYIPAYRRFLKVHPTLDAESRRLEENGENFIQYIFKQENSPEGKIWIEGLNNDLKNFFPNLKTFSQEFGNGQTEVYLFEDNLDMKVNKDFMGSALLHIAFILSHLKNVEKNKVILIEEPELFIFPGLQKDLRNLFLEKCNKFQIFITTHSREFISEIENLCSIYSVKKEGNQSEVYKIPKEKITDVYEDLGLNIDEYERQKELIYNEAFWDAFIKKAIQDNRVENKLWDFKLIFEMWKAPIELKENKQIDFCENVASFANNEGGILIVGITNDPPRKIVGVENIESKIEDCHKKILRLTNSKKDFFYIQPVHIKNEIDELKDCFVIIIAQTKRVIGVRHKKGLWAYKRRLQTGKNDFDLRKLEDLKKSVLHDNYNYLRYLKTFCDFKE